MSKLPVLSGKECVQRLQKHGFMFRRQKGSHIILRHKFSKIILTIPNHKELDRGTLRAIIRQSGLELRDFL
ncbi:MAG: type II toxin-antitoxin system HicA family toxin [Oligoflexia bacterium]|nr:type II toxin-antitoxin system HicA family toxin [Oligoflexia bacterium]